MKKKYNKRMTSEAPKPQADNAPYPENWLRAVTPIDGRYGKDLEVLSPYSSEMGLQSARTEIEARHLIGLSRIGVIRSLTGEETDLLMRMGPELTLDQARRIKTLELESDHDVQAVEKMMREELSGTSLADVTPFLHFPLTSEDVNNLAYRLMFKRASERVIVPAVDKVIDKVLDIADKEKGTIMLARTHGQAGVPTTLGKEMLNFAIRMNREARKLKSAKLTGKFNGAVGNFNAHQYARPDIDWQKYAKDFVEDLGFEYNPYTTQINSYEDMIEMFQIYQRLNGVFLDFDQDMWRYISDDWFSQIPVAGETGSSTMAQKINPIRFENSEGNITMANAILEGMGRKLSISRLQRDLSDSTVIRNAVPALGYSLLSYQNTLRGLGRVTPNHEEIGRVLNEDWSTLTEGVQVYLRTEGRDDAYDMVKKAARGVHISPESWETWVDGLDITDAQKEHVKRLSPQEYVGIAEKITEQGIAEIRVSRAN